MDFGQKIKGKGQMNARVENTKATLKGIVSDLKEVGMDVKDRIVSGTEPKFSKRYQGMAVGHTGSLAADVLVLPVAIVDRIEEHIHGFAQINRRLIGR